MPLGLDYNDNSTIDCGFVIGYGGWVVMTRPEPGSYKDIASSRRLSNPILLQATSANVTRQLNIPVANSYFTPHDGVDRSSSNGVTYKEAKSPIRLGYGTYAYSGEVSFEMTEGTLDFLTGNTGDSYGDFFRRDSLFDLQFFDGMKTCTIYNCAWSNFNIQGNPNSAVTAHISFQSNNGYNDDLVIDESNYLGSYSFNSDDLLIPYWNCGNLWNVNGKEIGIESFTISFSRGVSPVYLNNPLNTPTYLRPGVVEVTVDMETIDYEKRLIKNLEQADGGDANDKKFIIYVGKKKIEFNKAILANQVYNMSTMTDVGSKSYQWTSMGDDSKEPLFYISNR